MIDTMRLNTIIKKSGLKKKYLAQKLGLSPYGLARKIDGKSEFLSREIVGLSEELGITDPREMVDIFFSKK